MAGQDALSSFSLQWSELAYGLLGCLAKHLFECDYRLGNFFKRLHFTGQNAFQKAEACGTAF